MERGRSSGSSRLISLWETTACTTAESKKPRISGHRISHPMAKAMASACASASIIGCSDDSNDATTQPWSDRFGSDPSALKHDEATDFVGRHKDHVGTDSHHSG